MHIDTFCSIELRISKMVTTFEQKQQISKTNFFQRFSVGSLEIVICIYIIGILGEINQNKGKTSYLFILIFFFFAQTKKRLKKQLLFLILFI